MPTYAGNLHIEAWSSFFSTIAQVSGGLVGLVFVALTFKPEVLGPAGDVGMRSLARQTFFDFLIVMVASLFMLTPVAQENVLALPALGVAGTSYVLGSLLVMRRVGPAAVARKAIMERLRLSLVGNLLLVLSAGLPLGLLSAGSFWSLIMSALLMLMISGMRSAWILVVHEGGS